VTEAPPVADRNIATINFVFNLQEYVDDLSSRPKITTIVTNDSF
jgi:hypothetical protein